MTKTLMSLSLALAMGLAAPLSAQESDGASDATTEDQQAQTETGTAQDEQGGGETGQASDGAAGDQAPDAEAGTEGTAGLSMGEATEGASAEGEPREGQPYIREEFSDWAIRCMRAPEGNPDPCQLYQLLQDEDGNNVAEISVFPLEDGGQAAAGATIVAPLETLLTENLTLSVDGGSARTYPFTFCNRAGCVARVGFTQEEVNQFKRGVEAQIRMVPAAAPDQEVTLDISLSGFTDAYDSSTE